MSPTNVGCTRTMGGRYITPWAKDVDAIQQNKQDNKILVKIFISQQYDEIGETLFYSQIDCASSKC